MKKFLAILLLTATSLFGQAITGTGTYGDPWMIYTPGNLDSIRTYMFTMSNNDGYKIFELANDIDMESFTYHDGSALWFPLMITTADTFGFNGGGFTISNMDVRWDTTTSSFSGEKTSGRAGFIGYWLLRSSIAAFDEPDTVKNIIFDNISIKWDSSGVGLAGSAVTTRTTSGVIAAWVEKTTNYKSPRFENIKVINSYVRFNPLSDAWTQAGSAIGLAFGFTTGNQIQTGFEFHQVGVENSTVWSLVQRAGGNHTTGIFMARAGLNTTTGWDFTECYVKNSTLYSNFGAGRYEWAGDVPEGGFLGMAATQAITITDSYVYNVNITVNGLLGGASDENRGGGFLGYSEGVTNNTYVAGNTNVRLFGPGEAGSDQLGWYMGLMTAGATETGESYLDTVGMGVNSWYGDYGEDGPVVGHEVNLKTSAEMILEATYSGWDFTNIWAIRSITNDNYPYLQWELPGVELTAPIGGEAFSYPDTLYITWAVTSGADTIYIYYSLDNGFEWTRAPVETAVADTFMIPVGLSSSQFKIRITTTDSSSVSTSGTFEYLGSTTVTILEPLNVTGIVNDGTYKDSIVVESILADSVSLWYSIGDTLNWILLVEGIPQPEVLDTVFWYWNPVPYIVGDIYIKAASEIDTVRYGPFDSTIVSIGSQRPNQPQICWSETGTQSSIFRNFELDVSCGWSTPALGHYSIVINDFAEGYTFLSTSCPQPCSIPIYPTNGTVFIYDGGDTTETAFKDFYEEQGTTVTYKQRLYWIGDSTLYMNDLRNDIDSIALVDLSEEYYAVSGDGWVVNPTLSIYNVQWSKVVADTLAINTDFEALNDPGFIPRLVISGAGAPFGDYPGITYDLLDAPPSGEYDEDVQLAYSGFSYLRYYFRGIDPKIRKD